MYARLLFAALCCGCAAAQSGTPAFLVDLNRDLLFAVDLATGAATPVGSTANNGLTDPTDLCWRDDTNEWFTIDLAGGEVGTLDPLTGAFTVRWQTNLNGWQAMAWDPGQHVFWLHNQTLGLFRLDPATGTTTAIGMPTPSNLLLAAMAVDATGTLWGFDFFGARLWQVDKATGQTSQRTPAVIQLTGLAIDAGGRWFGTFVNQANPFGIATSLYRIDPVAGTSTLVGPTGAEFAGGLAIAGSAVQRAGVPCADGGANVRRMTWSGASNLGNTLQVGIELGPTSVPASLVWGFSATQAGPFALPLSLAPFGASGCTLYDSADAITGGVLSGLPVPLAIPVAPSFLGVVAYAQGAVIDVTATPNPLGLAFTDVARIVVTQ